MAMAQGRQSRCACTLPFSLHLTVMILGIVGIILSIVVMVVVFLNDNWYRQLNGSSSASAKGSAIWLLFTTLLIFVSGLQGLLVRKGSKGFICHIVLAVINLLNLGVWVVAVIFIGSPFWIIYMIAVFVLELWVTVLRTCCKTREVGEMGSELPVANPGVVQGYAVDMPASGQAYPPTYHVDPRPEANGLKAPHPGQGRTYDQFEEVR